MDFMSILKQLFSSGALAGSVGAGMGLNSGADIGIGAAEGGGDIPVDGLGKAAALPDAKTSPTKDGPSTLQKIGTALTRASAGYKDANALLATDAENARQKERLAHEDTSATTAFDRSLVRDTSQSGLRREEAVYSSALGRGDYDARLNSDRAATEIVRQNKIRDLSKYNQDALGIPKVFADSDAANQVVQAETVTPITSAIDEGKFAGEQRAALRPFLTGNAGIPLREAARHDLVASAQIEAAKGTSAWHTAHGQQLARESDYMSKPATMQYVQAAFLTAGRPSPTEAQLSNFAGMTQREVDNIFKRSPGLELPVDRERGRSMFDTGSQRDPDELDLTGGGARNY